jgi:hypothetical protein
VERLAVALVLGKNPVEVPLFAGSEEASALVCVSLWRGVAEGDGEEGLAGADGHRVPSTPTSLAGPHTRDFPFHAP